MRIDRIVCPAKIQDKLESRHKVRVREVRQVLVLRPRIRFAEKGNTEGEDVYAAFGRSYAGRYLVVVFVYKPKTKTAIIISARDMSKKERKAYGHK